MGRAEPMGQLIMNFTGPVLGWAWSTWARAGLGRELVSPWRTLEDPRSRGHDEVRLATAPGRSDAARRASRPTLPTMTPEGA